ncbi:GntR family transcriptional regulator [Winogradskyella forsetii]|uniref:GntR family transcriptional regulator n=1 Tax=Winogradskyella forsetii TaxID=2686077 RepID=UPI0015BE2A05|nr:GntR family transcriptional regulator [Winogradskyella forsetii]
MSIIHVDSKAGIPKYRQIIQSVELGLDQGQLKKGDKLPSVNSIKNRFSLSRDTVFMAFGELKKRGIIEAVTGKGYYIKSEDVKVAKNVFLLFDELNSFKEDLYNSILNAFGENVQVDIFFHHFNQNVFDKLINDSVGNYNYYIVMPASLDHAYKALKTLPKDQVFLLDQTHKKLKNYAGVFQNFERNVYDGLMNLNSKIKGYNELVFVNPISNQPIGIFLGYEKFMSTGVIKGSKLEGVASVKPKQGAVYFVLDDRSLIELIKKINQTPLKIGKDVGIIAYNDSLLKEIVEGGITTISTDFKEMGARMANMIINEEFDQIENPNHILIRNSI